MDEQPRAQERAFYRLQYPLAERPHLQVDDRSYKVSEISEEGARILLADSAGLDDGQSFEGVIQFHDGETHPIEGVVLRTDGNEFVVNLTRGVSLKRMMDEQIRLRQKYPTTRNPAERSDGEATA